MLLAHKVELRPSAARTGISTAPAGTRRHAYNQLLALLQTTGRRVVEEDSLRAFHPGHPAAVHLVRRGVGADIAQRNR